MIRKEVVNIILEKAILLDQFGMNDLTWEKEDAKALIISLMSEDIGILGGSVYKIESQKLVPMYDNWSCNQEINEKNNDYYFNSKLKSLNYIDRYPVLAGENILFSLVFTEDIDSF